MEYAEAKRELLRHAGIAEDYYEFGFTGCLRPYSGLREDNFHRVVESMISIAQVASRSLVIERSVGQAVCTITVYSRQWGIVDGGMLVRNRLISADDRNRLRRWVGIIEDLMLDMFAGRKAHESIHGYCEYVAAFNWGDNFAFFIPLLAEAIDGDDIGDRLQGHCAAIAKLGSNGRDVADSLARAKERNWNWYEPHDRCAAEMRVYIQRALDMIGAQH